MPPEAENNLRLEIAHVLFIDIVGYSKGLINEQSDSLAGAEGDFARDGAILFRGSKR